jgi:hypothetical protein
MYICIFYTLASVKVSTPATIRPTLNNAVYVISSSKKIYDNMSVNKGDVKTSAETI